MSALKNYCSSSLNLWSNKLEGFSQNALYAEYKAGNYPNIKVLRRTNALTYLTRASELRVKKVDDIDTRARTLT